jgi:hypothetical protein
VEIRDELLAGETDSNIAIGDDDRQGRLIYEDPPARINVSKRLNLSLASSRVHTEVPVMFYTQGRSQMSIRL